MVFRIGYTQQSGTPADVKAMFDRAIAALKADKTKALSEFNGKNKRYSTTATSTFSATTCPTANSLHTQIQP
jgi:hypothetical protein